VLVREHLARAAHPGLHLVEQQQRAVPLAQLAHRLEVAAGAGDHPGLALQRLEQDRASLLGDGLLDLLHLAVVDEAEPAGSGPKPCWYFGCPVAANEPIVRPWKELFMQTISMRSGCPWSTCQRRASLIIASFASVPLLQKKTRSSEAQPRQLLRQAEPAAR